jgi:hypothetical protein
MRQAWRASTTKVLTTVAGQAGALSGRHCVGRGNFSNRTGLSENGAGNGSIVCFEQCQAGQSTWRPHNPSTISHLCDGLALSLA